MSVMTAPGVWFGQDRMLTVDDRFQPFPVSIGPAALVAGPPAPPAP
jgi:hypothetical protein